MPNLDLHISNSEQLPEHHWDAQALTLLLDQNYEELIQLYKLKIKTQTNNLENYCFLGLTYLLQGEEHRAEEIWSSFLWENEFSDSAAQILKIILENESTRQQELRCLETSWQIRWYLKELFPLYASNLLELILLSIEINKFDPNFINEWKVVESLSSTTPKEILEPDLVKKLLDQVLAYQSPEILEITALLASCIEDVEERRIFITKKSSEIFSKNPEFASELLEICLNFAPQSVKVWLSIVFFSSRLKNSEKSINAAINAYQYSQDNPWKAFSLYNLLRELMIIGRWIQIDNYIFDYKNCLNKLIQEPLEETNSSLVDSLITFPSLLQYFQDTPAENRYLQNQVAALFQKKLLEGKESKILPKQLTDSNASKTEKISFSAPSLEELADKSDTQNNKKIKIGFIAHTLRLHSVGWLSRWIFQYYDSQKYDFSLFLISQNEQDSFTKTWFTSKVSKAFYFDDNNPEEIVKKIKSESIQILIDLDSTTLYATCNVLAHKPAPIQVTWLGFDASGISAVDYFIADPYVLPSNAQTYYQEKIWRLPQTYIAVDGFEVGTPTQSRSDLNIPEESIVFFSAQAGLKRNPHIIRLQLEILKAVPNSYFLIKGLGEDQSIQDLFFSLAQQVGVDQTQLRFLPWDATALTHRANLHIADVILDTYPYNGATTTLEALWMGIPLVTYVGEQFSARNSYAFLKQVGITEGIATTDEEYIQWGKRFGLDKQLRQKVSHQLRQSRQTSPLWDAKGFTRNLEEAFEQMWEQYTQG